jgi:hypothetical protein
MIKVHPKVSLVRHPNTIEIKKNRIWDYLEYMCGNVSTHGGNWLPEIKNIKLKSIYMIAILALQIIMFFMFISTFTGSGITIYTSTDWINPKHIEFPYITVCNPRMFDLSRVQGIR